MTDPRTSTALRHLDLPGPLEPAWDWDVVRVGAAGRIRLPDAAREVLGATDGPTPVVVFANGDALLVRAAPEAGRPRTVDGRGRLYIPRWLRSHPALVVGTGVALRLVLLAPVQLLDPIGERLCGSAR
jgi:bifunctional DNA-binding transcriptional regulator/antitoxin component of YhaV-PrlF toxin-antitoxin module